MDVSTLYTIIWQAYTTVVWALVGEALVSSFELMFLADL